MRSPRYAIAYTPLPSSPLARFGASVLGYDCFDRVDMPRLMVHRLDPAVLALAPSSRDAAGSRPRWSRPFA
jgi:hypothetical protein